MYVVHLDLVHPKNVCLDSRLTDVEMNVHVVVHVPSSGLPGSDRSMPSAYDTGRSSVPRDVQRRHSWRNEVGRSKRWEAGGPSGWVPCAVLCGALFGGCGSSNLAW